MERKREMIDIKEAVGEWLAKRGYDGLYCVYEPCGCKIGDLAPCGGTIECCECVPGYLRNVTKDDKCGCDGAGRDHWHIGPKKGGGE